MPFAQTSNSRIFYREIAYTDAAKSGDTVIWLAGLGQDHVTWGMQAISFARHFRCILPDNRDVGQTERATQPYTARTMADDVAALMDALGIERAHIVGVSLGGVIAQEFALAHPERLNRLVLLATFATSDVWLRTITEGWMAMHAALPTEAYTRAVLPWIYTPRTFAERPDFIDLVVRQTVESRHPQDAQAHARQAVVSRAHDARARLPCITAPTLVLVGDTDILTPPRYAAELAALIPGAQLHILPGGGHGAIAEVPQAINAALLDFLG